MMEKKQAFEAWQSKTKEERALHPTGKYIVPRQQTVTRDRVAHFFGTFGTFFMQEDENNYFIYFDDDAFRLPPRRIDYLNGTSLTRYHLTEKAYWDHVERFHEKFHELAQCHKDELIEMKMIDGRRFYSLPPIPTLDLPHGYTWEAFRRKVRHSARKHVTLTLKKAEQPAYHSHLVTQFSKLPTNYPCIGCTIAIDDSTVQMSMTCINSVDALRCIAKHISYLQFRLD